MEIKLANVSDISEGKGIVVYGPCGQEIALFKIKEKIYALDNACPHSGGPLGEGLVENEIVTCPWHAWQFNIKTGACQNMPGLDAQSIPIHVKGEGIFLIINE